MSETSRHCVKWENHRVKSCCMVPQQNALQGSVGSFLAVFAVGSESVCNALKNTLLTVVV